MKNSIKGVNRFLDRSRCISCGRNLFKRDFCPHCGEPNSKWAQETVARKDCAIARVFM